MHKPKILFLGALPPPFMGPTIATEILLNSSLKEFFELIHLDTSDHRELNTLEKIDFTNITLALKQYCLFLWLVLIKKPSIVYIPISQTSIGYLRDTVYILIAKIFGKKVVCHLRGSNFRGWFISAGRLMRWTVRHVHCHVDIQIVLGENLRHLFSAFLPRRKIWVIPNGGDFIIKNRQREPSKRLQILSISNIQMNKGFSDILNAAPLVHRALEKVDFTFVGDLRNWEINEYIASFRQAYPDLPVHFVGTITGQQKYDLLETADIFVFTPRKPEGHPWVIVEAMAAGLPIISTDKGAITESVINGVNGFIVESSQHHELAETMLLLSNDDALRREMGKKSRQLYEENFTEEKMVDRFCQVFNAVLME